MTFRRSSWVSVGGLAVLVAGILATTVFRQDISDWLQLRNYKAPAVVAQLASDTRMTDEGRRIFYVADPSIESKQSFRTHCPVEETTIVLGCYDGKRIYVLKVDDERLAGVEQVTTAHEMLHAAYQRLSSKDKTRINRLVTEAYAKQSDSRLTKTIDAYRAKDPSIVENELHSILGTEVVDVGPELEAYYQQYFTNRAVVVAYAQKYESVFTKLEEEVARYDTQLTNWKKQIDALEPKVAEEYASVAAEQKRLDGLFAAKKFEQYNAAVPSFNAQVRAYNASVGKLQKLISDYNALVVKRNQVATSQADLTGQLNASYDAVETQ